MRSASRSAKSPRAPRLEWATVAFLGGRQRGRGHDEKSGEQDAGDADRTVQGCLHVKHLLRGWESNVEKTVRVAAPVSHQAAARCL